MRVSGADVSPSCNGRLHAGCGQFVAIAGEWRPCSCKCHAAELGRYIAPQLPQPELAPDFEHKLERVREVIEQLGDACPQRYKMMYAGLDREKRRLVKRASALVEEAECRLQAYSGGAATE